MRRIFLIILLFPLLLFAQDRVEEGVELPEFVITGSQNVTLPVMKKKRPKPIPVLNQEFFLPAYAPDNLTLAKFNYSFEDFSIKKTKEKYFGGVLLLGGGLHTLPEGVFTIDKNIKRLLLHGKLWGFNVNDFVKYSNYNESGGELGLAFYLSKKSRFMPGMKIASFVKGMRNSFYLYGSKRPSLLRESSNILTKLQLRYSIKRYFNYDINFSAGLFEISKGGLQDFNYKANGFFQYKFTNAGVKFDYKILRDEFKFDNKSLKERDFYYGRLSVSLIPFNSFTANLGMSYAKQDTNVQITPTATFQLKLDEGIYLFGEYLPFAEYKTFTEFFNKNRFLRLSDIKGRFVDYSSVFRLAFKFDYKKVLDFSTGLELKSVRDLPYFQKNLNDGIFEIKSAEKANLAVGFVQAIVTTERFGKFYLKTEVSDVRNSVGNIVPYYPFLKLGAVYSYFFPFGFYASIDLNYYYNYYVNIRNTKKLKNYLNLSLDLNYKLSKSLELFTRGENLLNWKNYSYDGYLEKPLDVILGLRYRF